MLLVTITDRHVDDRHALFSDFDVAQRWCVNQMRAYGKRYVWREPEWTPEPTWLWYRETEIDDGPRVMIANIELDSPSECGVTEKR